MKYYLIYLTLMSVVTFVMYVADKNKAQKGRWRTSEKALLSMSFLGGAIGGYLAMHLARHKTKHWYFHVVNVLGLIWQIGLLVWLITAV